MVALSDTDRALLAELADPGRPLFAIAHDHNLDLADLADFASRDDLQPTLDKLHKLIELRLKLALDAAATAAVLALHHLLAVSEDPIEIRRAATAILRLHTARARRQPRPSAPQPEPNPDPPPPRHSADPPGDADPAPREPDRTPVHTEPAARKAIVTPQPEAAAPPHRRNNPLSRGLATNAPAALAARAGTSPPATDAPDTS